MCGRFSAQFESFVKPYPQVRSTDSKDVWFLLCNYFGKAFKNLCNISDHVFITLCHKRHSHPPLISILESKSIKSFVVSYFFLMYLRWHRLVWLYKVPPRDSKRQKQKFRCWYCRLVCMDSSLVSINHVPCLWLKSLKLLISSFNFWVLNQNHKNLLTAVG